MLNAFLGLFGFNSSKEIPQIVIWYDNEWDWIDEINTFDEESKL